MSNTEFIRTDAALPRAASRRRVTEAGAVALGIGAGIAWADPVLAAAGGVWQAYVFPAFQTMIENGLLAWCF